MLSEQDVRTKFITPAIVEKAGWDRDRQLREEVYFTDGRIIVQGSRVHRAPGKKADYILYYKPNIPLAVVEAKDGSHLVGSGMQQAMEYAEILDIPFVYSTNGKGFLEHDRTKNDGQIETELSMDDFPTPRELWRRYSEYSGLNEKQEKIVLEDYFRESEEKTPRYYQLNAINKAVEAVAKGKKRLLLVMATGTGKTYTAFQIIWRLWKAKAVERVLFLADRNVLVNQTKTNDFKPFQDKMTKITSHSIDRSYEIYLSLYQAITGPAEDQKAFKNFSKDFFDLIVIDECHRGSAAEDSAWREILDYFDSAVHLGMTATPKETKYVSNITYFGEPLYTYSLKQGIEDGFLAPYKVIRITMDKDDGWRPESKMIDRYGNEIPDQIYNLRDFDRTITLSERTKSVARKISNFLKQTDRFGKTIVFCENIEHAEHMRQALINENGDLVSTDSRYIMRITGDNPLGKKELDNFILPWEPYPVIAVTSRLMTTGVDAKTCKCIVIDRTINSLSEFKQIIGRGTRIDEEYGKQYFSIIDFRRATNLFADPDFDGEPEVQYEINDTDDLDAAEIGIDENLDNGSEEPGFPDDGTEEPRKKYVVDNVPVWVVNERVQYLDGDGKLITESLKDYTKQKIKREYRSLESFLKTWTNAERKRVIIEELYNNGILFDALREEVGEEYDDFDLICHIAFDKKPKTRSERAKMVKSSDYFSRFEEKARNVLEIIIDKYSEEGIENIEDMKVLKIPPFDGLGSYKELVQSFGGPDGYRDAIRELERLLYSAA